jgi:FkbM family methyltransferase
MIAEALKTLIPRSVREKLWKVRALPFRTIWTLLVTVAPRDYRRALNLLLGRPSQETDVIALALWGDRSPVYLRANSSDFDVFRQVFLERQYAGMAPTDSKVIFDAGANVGLASRFFLRQCRTARVIAIEPDPDNFLMAQRNLSGHASRCEVLRAAVWGESGTLAVQRGDYRDGREWSTRVIPAGQDSALTTPAYSVTEIMALFGCDTVDLLKMDIEGAEINVFNAPDTSFLKRVRSCAIELHGPDCEKAFFRAAKEHGFTEYRTQSEVVLAWRTPDGVGA